VSLVAEHCYLLFQRLGNNNETDQGDKTEGFDGEGLKRYILEREGVKELHFV
jgi:hypothetical protein